MKYSESADVSSGATVQAVRSALRSELFHPFPELETRRKLLDQVNRLPQGLARRIVELASWRSGLSRKLVSSIRTGDLADWNVAQMEEGIPDKKYETIVLGAPSGGAAYLASCLGAPFLSHTFLASFRQRNHPDDIAKYQRKGEELITPILSNNGDLHIVNHYDPVHDRFLIGHVNHVRMKLLDLPAAYADFIKRRLSPTGKLIVLNCAAQWGQYAIKPRYTFQVGGLGGLTDVEFTRGSERLDAWLQAQGSRQRGGWQLPMHWSRQPESEWGSLPPFVDAVRAFGDRHDIPVRVVTQDQVEGFSRLAFHAWQWLYYLLGMRPLAVLVDGFIQMNASAPRKSAVLPLWLPFNCADSRDFLAQMIPEFPDDTPVLFQPWPSFSPGPDTVTTQEWHQALHGLRGRWLGVNPLKYPMDLSALVNMTPALGDWLERHPDPLPRPLRLAEFESLLEITGEPMEESLPEDSDAGLDVPTDGDHPEDAGPSAQAEIREDLGSEGTGAALVDEVPADQDDPGAETVLETDAPEPDRLLDQRMSDAEAPAASEEMVDDV
jgi:hypothetical protein